MPHETTRVSMVLIAYVFCDIKSFNERKCVIIFITNTSDLFKYDK